MNPKIKNRSPTQLSSYKCKKCNTRIYHKHKYLDNIEQSYVKDQYNIHSGIFTHHIYKTTTCKKCGYSTHILTGTLTLVNSTHNIDYIWTWLDT